MNSLFPILRYFFLLFFAALLSSCQVPKGSKTMSKGLKDYSDFPVGGAFKIMPALKDKKLLGIIRKDFSSITSSNDMKMYSFASREGVYNWEKGDSLVALGIRNKQRIFGHTLVWHLGLPQWISENGITFGPTWVDSFLHKYIHDVVGRYKGKVAAWDVVNEAFETAGGAYRKTFWYEQLGQDYIAKAFRYAHEADPDAVLFYNDFNIERDTAKLHGVLRMIQELQAAGVPISGLGFQMHLRMDIPNEVIAYSLEEAAKTGLQIHLSEVDIIFNTHNDAKGGGKQLYTKLTEEMALAQKEKYKQLVLMYRKYVPRNQQYGITFWNFNDRDTWIKRFFNIEDWPTVYDEKLEPKPAYEGFIEGLNFKLQ